METPRIYVADLAAHNAGEHRGVWIDCVDADAVREEIAEMLADSSVDDAEDYAIHDSEGFPFDVAENESIDELCDIGEALEQHGEPYEAWLANEEHDVARFEEAYLGEFDSVEDYARDFLGEMGVFDNVVEPILSYFDFESYARDLEAGGEIWSDTFGNSLFVFRSV